MAGLSIIRSRNEPSGWRFRGVYSWKEAGERDVGTCSGDDAVARVPGEGVVACLETHDLKADS